MSVIVSKNQQYSFFSKLLHWIVAICVISQIGIGWYVVGLDNETVEYFLTLDKHQALGLIILLLFFIKTIWYFISPSPAFEPSLSPFEIIAARFAHALLYLVMLVLPLIGLIYVASNGEPINIYDLFEIPELATLSKNTRDLLSDAHFYLAYSTAALITIHVLAAFMHHFIKRDNTLKRMLF